MNRQTAMAAIICSMFALGCNKKPPKPTDSSEEPARPSASREKPNDKLAKSSGTKGDKAAPNWLTDPRYNKGSHVPADPEGDLQGKPGWGLAKPDGGWTGGNPPPANGVAAPNRPASPGGTGGAPAAPTGSGPAGGGKPVSEQDMKDIGIYIDNRSGASGQMPSPKEVLEALAIAKSPAADLVRDGYIILTGVRTREGIWAYEKNAPFAGGWVVGPNGTERLTAAQVNSRLTGR